MSGREGRDILLGRLRKALAHRTAPELPHVPRLMALPPEEAVDLFSRRFIQNGGEVVRFVGTARARVWLEGFCREFESASVGMGVPADLVPPLPPAPPESSPLGVSLARWAVAETGSLGLSSREGRLVQLLPPCHLIWVREGTVVSSLGEALSREQGDLPAALALHSGPSRSADIGQIMVQGVHGPGRVIVGIIP